MTLILTLTNAEAGGQDMKTEFLVEGDGAVIGRSKNCNWTLPDPTNTISSRHAEIRRDGSNYLIRDISTNGTFLNDAGQRMTEEHLLKPGDKVRIGKYELVATIGRLERHYFVAPDGAEPDLHRIAEDWIRRSN